jgi:hypothetical protein
MMVTAIRVSFLSGKKGLGKMGGPRVRGPIKISIRTSYGCIDGPLSP